MLSTCKFYKILLLPKLMWYLRLLRTTDMIAHGTKTERREWTDNPNSNITYP